MNVGKLALVLVVIMFISGAIAAALTVAAIGGSPDNNGWTSTTEVNQRNRAPVDEVTTLDIDVVSTDVVVEIWDGDEFDFHYYGETTYRVIGDEEAEMPKLIVEQKGSAVSAKIEHPKMGWRFWHFGGDDALIVKIPRSYTRNLDIESVSAEVTINPLVLEELKIESVSGDVFSQAKAELVRLETVSGDVTSSSSERVTVDTTSGDVLLKDGTKLEVYTVSGDVTLDSDSYAVNFDSVSGDLYSPRSVSSNPDIIVETVSGDLTLV